MKKIRGFRDITPSEINTWEIIENTLIQAASDFDINQIKLPIMEQEALFRRGVGEYTDIVGKEMYAFADQNGDILALRPEGTAGAVRSFIEQGLSGRAQAKWYYHGPMFRRERPQKGRYRQFYQFGVELLGYDHLHSDIELISYSHHVLNKLGLIDSLTLKINFLPPSEQRAVYNQDLKKYLSAHLDQLDSVSKERIETNVLRIWDSKDQSTREVMSKAPRIEDYLDTHQKEQVLELKNTLNELDIDFDWDSTLVRGLDYYEGVVFEWESEELGAKSTICGGGRYNKLCDILGGQTTAATGLSFGIDRCVLLYNHIHKPSDTLKDMIVFPSSHSSETIKLRTQLIEKFQGVKIGLDYRPTSLKKMMTRAHKNGYNFCVFKTDDEWQIKDLAYGVQNPLSALMSCESFAEFVSKNRGEK